jgi:hypothetical protein
MAIGKKIAFVAIAALAAGLAGCLQIETRVLLNPDGSATITERVQFSRQLLNLDASATTRPEDRLESLLARPAVEARMAKMGKGMALVSHEVRDGEAASRESVTVFKIADIREFRYVSPFMAFIDYPNNNAIKCNMFPVYESTWYGRRAGQMAVTFSLEREGKTEPRPKEGEPPPPGPAPVSQQMLRYLQPIARDMLAGLKIRFTFESYSPLRFRQYFRYRNQQAGTHEFDLIDWSDKSLDQFSANLVDNEEVMLELVGGSFHSSNFIEATKEHGSNLTLAVFHPTGIPEIYFKPSRPLFDLYFAGKTLKFDERDGGQRPAKWEEVGYQGKDDNPPAEPAVKTNPEPPATTPTTQPERTTRPGRVTRPGRNPSRNPGRQPGRTPPESQPAAD